MLVKDFMLNNDQQMRKGATFGPRFDVVSKKGALPTVAVGPTKTNRRQSLTKHQVPWTAWRSRLGTSCNILHLVGGRSDNFEERCC